MTPVREVSRFRLALRRAKVRTILFGKWILLEPLLPLYKAALNRRQPDWSEPKPVSDLHYVTWIGRSYLPLLRENLASLHRSWDSIPHLSVVCDQGLQPEEVHASLNGWPGPIQVRAIAEVLTHLEELGYPQLLEFARQHQLGKKFAVVAEASLCHASTLWCDADILWFAPFDVHPDRPSIIALQDCTNTMDAAIAARTQGDAWRVPDVNSGLLLLKSDFLEAGGVLPVLESLLAEGANLSYFAEQSLFAVAVNRVGSTLPAEAFIVSAVDHALPIFRWDSWVARHYVSPVRKAFWRDAFFLRICRMKARRG